MGDVDGQGVPAQKFDRAADQGAGGRRQRALLRIHDPAGQRAQQKQPEVGDQRGVVVIDPDGPAEDLEKPVIGLQDLGQGAPDMG